MVVVVNDMLPVLFVAQLTIVLIPSAPTTVLRRVLMLAMKGDSFQIMYSMLLLLQILLLISLLLLSLSGNSCWMTQAVTLSLSAYVSDNKKSNNLKEKDVEIKPQQTITTIYLPQVYSFILTFVQVVSYDDVAKINKLCFHYKRL